MPQGTEKNSKCEHSIGNQNDDNQDNALLNILIVYLNSYLIDTWSVMPQRK